MLEYHSRMDGLGKDFKLMALGSGGIEELGRAVIPGDEENEAFWEQLADRNRGFNPTHAVHHYVRDQVVKS